MGTQQILMIVLSVIVVGAAVAVGIQMFDTQSQNASRQAIASEIVQMAAQAQAWYRTPAMMGGGGNETNDDGPVIDLDKMGPYINSTYDTEDATISNVNATYTLVNDNGELTISAVSKTDATIFVNARIDLTAKKGDSGVKINPNATDDTIPDFE
jgi:hypothetical protein